MRFQPLRIHELKEVSVKKKLIGNRMVTVLIGGIGQGTMAGIYERTKGNGKPINTGSDKHAGI